MDPSIAPVALRKNLADFIHDTSFEKLPQNVIHRLFRFRRGCGQVAQIEQVSDGKCAVPVRAPECGASRSFTQW